MQISYPFKPFQISQHWGNLNPSYSKQFGDPNFKRHNGVDAVSYYIDPTTGKRATGFNVFCPVEGFKVTEVAYYPQGGGNQIGMTSINKIYIDGVFCYVSILLCHAKKILVKVGDEPSLGQLLMIADNTGFSTGLHTHIGMYRLNDKYQKIDTNEATGSYNPELFFTGLYAIDQASLKTLLSNGMRLAKYYLTGL